MKAKGSLNVALSGFMAKRAICGPGGGMFFVESIKLVRDNPDVAVAVVELVSENGEEKLTWRIAYVNEGG